MSFFICLLIGGVAGWVAGQVMKDAGYGMVSDIAIGVIGGLVGGWVFTAIGIAGGIIGSIITAIIGAAILIGAFQAAKRAGLFAT